MTSEEGKSGHWRGFLRDPIILATLAVHLALAFFTAVPVLGPYATSLVLESCALVPVSILALLAPWVRRRMRSLRVIRGMRSPRPLGLPRDEEGPGPDCIPGHHHQNCPMLTVLETEFLRP